MISSDGLSLLFAIRGDSSSGQKASKEFRQQAEKDFNAVEQKTDSLNTANARLSKSFDGVATTSGKASAAMSSFVGNLAADVVLQFSQAVIAGGKAVLDYSSRIEQVSISFNTLTGSAETSKKLLKDLQEFAKTTPFEFADLTSFAQKLLGANVEIKNIIPLLRDVGNATSAIGGTKEDLEGVIRAITQIISKQKATAEELGQLSERNINGFKILAVELGKTEAEVRKLSEAGQISSDVFIKAFQNFSQTRFGDAMAEQSKTFSGSMSNIKDALLITASTAFEPLYKQISGLAARFANEISGQQKGFESIGDSIAKYIGEGLGAAVPALVENFGALLATKLKDLFTGNWKGFGFFAVSFVEGFYNALDTELKNFGQRVRDKLDWNWLKSQNDKDKVAIAPQTQNWMNPGDMETRMPGANTFANGSPTALKPTSGTKPAAKTPTDSFEKQFRDFAEKQEFRISSFYRPGTPINPGSLHGSKQAGDLSIKGKTVQEIIDVLAEGIKKGWRALDERFVGALPGIKSTGPNAHFDTSKKASMFIENRPDLYGGQSGLDYLKKLDADRLAGKTSVDEVEKFAKEKAEKEAAARAKRIAAIEAENKRIAELEAEGNETRIATLDSALANELIKESEHAELIAQIKLGALESEKARNHALLENTELTETERAAIVQRQALLEFDITQQKIANSDAVTAAKKRETEAYKQQSDAIQKEQADVAKARNEQFNDGERARYETELKTGKNRLQNLTDYRDFELNTIENARNAELERFTEEEESAKRRLRDLKNNEKLKFEIEELYKLKRLLSEEEFQARKKEIEAGFNPQIDQAEADASGGGMFGGLLSGLGLSVQGMLQTVEPLKEIGNIIGGQFNAIASAVGNAVKAFVLFGSAGGGFKKFAAEIIASVAQMAIVQALWEMAQWAAMTALFLFTANPKYALAAGAHLTAAIIYGAVGGVAMVAGRAMAGNSFKNETSGAYGTAGGSGGSGGQRDANGQPQGYSGRPDGVIENGINNPFANLKQTLILKIESSDSHIVKAVQGALEGNHPGLTQVVIDTAGRG